MMKFLEGNQNWYQLEVLPAKNFTCGYCGNVVSSEKGFGRI